MTPIEEYFWQLDVVLADTHPMRRNQIVSTVRRCVSDADQMNVFGKPVEEMTREEIDTNFGSPDYIFFVADNDLHELHQWGRLMTDINAFVPHQMQGQWLAIAAIYDMDKKLPYLAHRKIPGAKAWQVKKINFSDSFAENLTRIYLPITLGILCWVSLIMPILAFIPAIPAIIVGMWMLISDKGESWIATAIIGSAIFAMLVGSGTFINYLE